MVVLLSGDFRQTLPVISKGTSVDEINSCLKTSYLWKSIKILSLKTNMRVRLEKNTGAEAFSSLLLKIGNGEIKSDPDNQIKIPKGINIVTNEETLIKSVFPNILENINNSDWLCERAILASTNDMVDNMNYKIISALPGEKFLSTSVDKVVDADCSVNFPTEFLNSLKLSGMPPHLLYLKPGVPIMLMRNLQAPKLCNGTRLKVISFTRNVITASVLTGPAKGKEVMIPRIPMVPTDSPVQFRRLQFPVKLAFVMSINKAQGQTIKIVGGDLRNPCFSHGQFYVLCSRVSEIKNLYFLLPDVNEKTKNIVYKQIL